MPLIESSSYKAPLALLNGHVHTVVSALFRKVEPITYTRERIDTTDGDFLDLDWSRIGATRVAVLSHGLEGDSSRPYMIGMAKALNDAGWDVVSWNYRGCSGEPNLTPRLYHSGATEDLEVVINHAKSVGGYDAIGLVGFSLGGNIVLKYIGEKGESIAPEIKAGVCFSVGCDLKSSAEELAQPYNWHFMRVFLRSLRRKIQEKLAQFPDLIAELGLEAKFDRMRSFLDFDEAFTAPLHGFKSAEEYWAKCSSRQYLPKISIPTLLVNAKDDPMLREPSFPKEEAKRNPYFTLEIPSHGGHLGFAQFAMHSLHLPSISLANLSQRSFTLPSVCFESRFWSELRAVEFLQKSLSATI